MYVYPRFILKTTSSISIKLMGEFHIGPHRLTVTSASHEARSVCQRFIIEKLAHRRNM